MDTQVENVDTQAYNDLITDIGLVRNEADIKKREKGYFHYALNVLISDRLALDRTLPDTRHERYEVASQLCKTFLHEKNTTFRLCSTNLEWTFKKYIRSDFTQTIEVTSVEQ